MTPFACTRPGKLAGQFREMGKIMTFLKAFANVDSDDDFLLSIERGYSQTMDDTRRPKESVQIGTFPLHTGTCPLHTSIFFSLYRFFSQETT